MTPFQSSLGVAMSYPYTAEGAKKFLGYLIDKGLLNSNTGGGMRSACEKVFSVLDEDEKQNLNELDVDSAVRRFVNKNPGALSPDSLAVYSSRVKRVIEMLKRFNSDPAGFKPSTKVRPRPNDVETSPTREGQKKKGVQPSKPDVPNPQSSPEIPSGTETQNRTPTVTLTFPLRADFVAQFVVPKDLTLKDAKKLAAYFELIAVDFQPD
jgi:hypothetical protein